MARKRRTKRVDASLPAAFDPWIVEALGRGPRGMTHIAGFLAARLEISFTDPRLEAETRLLVDHAIKSGLVRVCGTHKLGGHSERILELVRPEHPATGGTAQELGSATPLDR
jgi:hypothetical protein